MSAPSAVADHWTDNSAAYVGFMLSLDTRPEIIAGNLGFTVDQLVRRLRQERLDGLATAVTNACAAARGES